MRVVLTMGQKDILRQLASGLDPSGNKREWHPLGKNRAAPATALHDAGLLEEKRFRTSNGKLWTGYRITQAGLDLVASLS